MSKRRPEHTASAFWLLWGMKNSTQLRARYERFCREYIIDLNATRAAIAAGYSKKTAYSMGPQLLKRIEVQELIGKLLAKRSENLDYSAERILTELSKMGFSNMLDFLAPDKESGELILDFSKLTRDQAAAIQEYTIDATGGTGDGERKQVLRTRFKLADKTRALELLGKYRKLFTERLEVHGLEGLADSIARGRKRLAHGG